MSTKFTVAVNIVNMIFPLRPGEYWGGWNMDLCHTAVFMYPVLARVACGVLSSKSVVSGSGIVH